MDKGAKGKHDKNHAFTNLIENCGWAQMLYGFLPEDRSITGLSIEVEVAKIAAGQFSLIERRERELVNVDIPWNAQVTIRLY